MLVYAILTGSFLYLIVVSLHRMAEEEIVEAARHKAVYISAAISGHLAEGDGPFLAHFLGGIVEGGDLEYARAEGTDGAVLAEAGISARFAAVLPPGPDLHGNEGIDVREIGSQEGLLHEQGHTFSIASPVLFEGKPAGRLFLGMNTKEVNRRIASVTYRALEIAAGLILLGILLTWFLYRQVKGSMQELIRTTASIAEGDLDRRALVATGDELEDLAGAFNRMAQAVGERERELTRVRNTMVSMFDGITEGIAYIDREYRILHANRAYAAYQGEGGDGTVTGRKCFELFREGEHACGDCPGRTALETGRAAQSEREVAAENGERRILRIHAYPVGAPGGEPDGFVEYVRDVTLQRTLEEELKEHAGRLEEIVRERTRRLREAQEQMIHKEKIAALGQMAAGVAHEIGNPLSALSSILRSFATRSVTAEGREEKLAVMQDQIDRIAKIVREMVDFSRPPSFGTNLVHVNEVLRTAIGIARYDGRFRGIHLITGMDTEIPALKLDGDRLLQVFLNILLNAADAMGGTGTLTLTSRRENRCVFVQFGDTGPGIPEEALPRIFEPFFTTKDVGKGSGLGLSVSYGIMQGMGGSIRAENQPGGGSLFTVVIPLPEPIGSGR
ncbi:MAG: hypothetical protein Kow00128_06830 [Deltaproteobacteria bacterium]